MPQDFYTTIDVRIKETTRMPDRSDAFRSLSLYYRSAPFTKLVMLVSIYSILHYSMSRICTLCNHYLLIPQGQQAGFILKNDNIFQVKWGICDTM